MQTHRERGLRDDKVDFFFEIAKFEIKRRKKIYINVYRPRPPFGIRVKFSRESSYNARLTRAELTRIISIPLPLSIENIHTYIKSETRARLLP